MKKSLSRVALLIFASLTYIACKEKMTSHTENMPAQSFYDLSVKSLDGNTEIKFSDFKGKKVLLVNVASECGYTPQYEDLEKLYHEYGDKLVVIGFPCNQFMGQEPGTAQEIQEFCTKNYGVTFLLSEKIDVKGPDQHPVYKWLTDKKLNGKDDYSVSWNFNKFLVDENGNLVAHFGSGTKPLSDDIVSLVKK